MNGRLKACIFALLATLVVAPASAFMGGMFVGGCGGASCVAAATLWNPADSGTSFVITNSGRTATATQPPFGNLGGRSIASKPTGKFNWEIRVDTLNSGTMEIGMAKSAWPENATVLNTANGAILRNNGTAGYNGSNVLISGFVVSVALDLTNSKIWWRTNSGNWNNSGTDDPATNTGGVSISGFATSAFAAAFLNSANQQAITARFSSSDWTLSAPSGFGQL